MSSDNLDKSLSLPPGTVSCTWSLLSSRFIRCYHYLPIFEPEISLSVRMSAPSFADSPRIHALIFGVLLLSLKQCVWSWQQTISSLVLTHKWPRLRTWIHLRNRHKRGFPSQGLLPSGGNDVFGFICIEYRNRVCEKLESWLPGVGSLSFHTRTHAHTHTHESVHTHILTGFYYRSGSTRVPVALL